LLCKPEIICTVINYFQSFLMTMLGNFLIFMLHYSGLAILNPLITVFESPWWWRWVDDRGNSSLKPKLKLIQYKILPFTNLIIYCAMLQVHSTGWIRNSVLVVIIVPLLHFWIDWAGSPGEFVSLIGIIFCEMGKCWVM
jgi:hypothetical protein